MSQRVSLNLDINGKRRRVTVPPMKRLLDVLREDCGLTGAKEGCGEGECGACSVLMDGRSVCSCLVPAGQAEGVKIVTVEGLAKSGVLSSLQRTFVAFGAAQCGICTPGMLITSVELLASVKGRLPGEDEVREALAGNLCRCTGYQKIVDAVRAVAKESAGKKPAARKATARKRAVRKPAAKATARNRAVRRPAAKAAGKRATRGARR
jgi:carbon-monoxide dehydrogenase small subunit